MQFVLISLLSFIGILFFSFFCICWHLSDFFYFYVVLCYVLMLWYAVAGCRLVVEYNHLLGDLDSVLDVTLGSVIK